MFFLFLLSQISLCSKSNSQKLIREGEAPVGERVEYNTNTEPIELKKKQYAYLDSSSSQGGAVRSTKTNITLSGCTFTSIKARIGGAIYIHMTKINDSVVPLYCNILNCEFVSCSSSENGGAAYLENTQPNAFTFDIEGCTFTSNQAQNGGAIYGKIRDEYVMKDCTFTDNKASVDGSSLWFQVGNRNGKDKNDTVILLDNKFLVGSDSASNVYIKNVPVDAGISAHASVLIGGCTFGAENPTNPKYKNLELVACPVGFENISFISCNCFKQGVNTLAIPYGFLIQNIDFECNSLESCSPDVVEQPTPPPEAPKTPEPKPDTDGYIPSERIVSEKDKEINLEKYKFTNTNTEAVDGGAIYINTNRVSCTLNNCKFDSCHGKNGGALYVFYAKVKSLLELKVSDCIFTKCEATETGGAIYVKVTQSRKYRILISSSTFRNNKAATDGGALCLLVRDNFTMKDCTFENNEAQSGSSVWCQIGWDANATENNTDNTAIFSSNTFSYTPTENSVNVYIQSHNVDITKVPRNAVLNFGQSRFIANGNVNNYKHLVLSNNGDGFQSISFPGCICVDKDKNTVTLPEGISDDAFTYNCQSYDSCKPDGDGYKFHDKIKDVPREGPIDLESFKFNSLSDVQNGGAITIDKHRVNCTIKKCKFESCKANNGGAIYIYYIRSDEGPYACTITETEFINNEATYYGGAIYCEITQANRHSVSISHCTFTSNKAKSGGAINANVRDSFSLEHCTFNNNVATGGTAFSLWCRIGWYDRYTENTAIIRDNQFTFTPANEKSINVYIESNYLEEDVSPNANLTFGGNVFKAENTEVQGYLHIKIKAPSEFEVLNFDSCNCIQQGPETVNLPYSYGSPEPYFGFNCQKQDTCSVGKAPEGPKPDADGYTSYQRLDFNVESTIRLTKAKFNNVQSTYSGGAVSLVKVSSVMNDCKFESCKSTYSNTKNGGGGAIYVSYTGKENAVYSLFISGCTFNKCESKANGGAVMIYISQAKRHSAIIEDCTFTQNKAVYNGGGVYAEGRDLFTVRYCTFTNNEAVNGSSLYCITGWYNGNTEKDNAFQLIGNTFSIQANKPTSNNVYIKNTYLQEGISPNANVYIGKCQFASKLNGNGQRHLIIEEVGEFQSIQFTGCNCVQGGENTVEIKVASKPDISNGFKFDCNKMDECTAGSEVPPPSDGCNYQNRQEAFKAEIKKENNCFYNLSSVEGGAAKAVNALLELKNCRFNNCSSSKDGGAVYASFTAANYQFHLSSCTFDNCYSGRRGGAVFFDNQFASKSSISSCTFTNNKAKLNGGALYYAPCANSILNLCLFENNTVVTTSDYNYHGSSVYVLIKNLNANTASKKLSLTEGDNVVIKGNTIKSEPTENGRQMYINLKETGKLELGENSFSFNDAKEIPQYSRFLQLDADKGAEFSVTGEICLDSNEENNGLISGIDSNNIKYDCKPQDYSKGGNPPKGNKSNLGLIIGVTVAAVVVVVVIIVVVVIVLKRRQSNKYISDIADEDNQTGPNTTDAEYGASTV